MLCIATPNPDSPPETYIRQHIRSIALGETVVLYFQGDGESLLHVPSLRIPIELKTNWMERSFRSIANVALHSYPSVVSGYPAEEVKEFLVKHDVRSILAEFGPTGCALLPICRELGIRLVVNFHGHDATVMPKRWVIRQAYHHLNKHADAFICGSQHFSEVLINLGFSKEKIHVVPCGIELDQFDPGCEKDPNLIVAVGRFVEKKAPHLTIQAFIKVLEQQPNTRLEMIGDGPLMSMCKEMVRNEGVEEKVILHGARPHEFVKQKLATASLFVQHSVVAANGDTESQGISLLEAMASEVPVVSTRHNGFVETVIDGETGYLVEEGDVNGMAERMIELLNNKGLCDRMGKAGRQRVAENYESGKIAAQLHDLLML
jgi:colanic acid/amylovoran biosynthesis glycosyltransferase